MIRSHTLLAFWIACVPVFASDDSTVALWLFDEPENTPNRGLLEDWTLHGYDLTLHPGARLVTGRYGRALEVLGGSRRTAIRRYIDPTPLNLDNTDWTWECWMQPKAAAQTGDVLFQIREGPFDQGPVTGITIGESADQLVFTCELAEISQVLETQEELFAAANAEWHHIALTYSADDRQLSYWVDGTLADRATLPAELKALKPTGENNFSLGADINGWHPLPVLLDEVRFSSTVRYESPFAPPATFSPQPEPLELGLGPHLFIDDSLIANSENLRRTTHSPKREAEPVLRQYEVRPGWVRQFGGRTVKYDPDRKQFQMWTHIKNHGFEEPDFYSSTYWESKDGVHWTAPELGVLEFDGRRDHNIIMTGRTHNLRFHSDGVLDEGPNAKDPSRRFKIGYFPLDWRQDHTNGFNVSFSPDGIHWTPYQGNPVMRHWDVVDGHPGAAITVADINDLFYDAKRDLYVQTYKTYALPNEYPMAPHRRTERWREVNDATRGYRRLVGLCTSRDFIHWTGHQRVMVPDDDDPPELQFYSFSIHKRGDLYLGYVRCLDDEAGKYGDGTGWMELATSRDLYHWQRHRDVFFDRNPDDTAWDGQMCWHSRPAEVGDEFWYYYTGYSTGHKTGERSIGLARLRRDGFVSRDAGGEEATLQTITMNLPDVDELRLALNAKVTKGGHIKVEVGDQDGVPLPGYELARSNALQGDGTAMPVSWKTATQLPTGQPIQLRFVMRDASLFGFAYLASPKGK